jgi:hypothetical protein
MSMPKDEIQTEVVSAWKTYVEALEKSLDIRLTKNGIEQKARCDDGFTKQQGD